MAFGYNIDQRKTNKRNRIVDLFRRSDTLSKIQAKQLSGYSMDTVLSIFDGLLADELIVPAEGEQKPKGRKAVFFRLNDRKHVYLGITFNQSGVFSSLVSFSGRVLDTASTELDLSMDRERFLAAFRAHLADFRVKNSRDLPGLRLAGCSVPGDVDRERGVLRSYTFMPYLEGVDFRSLIGDLCPGCAVEIEHNIKSMTSYFIFNTDLVRRYRRILVVSARSGPACGIIYNGEVVTDRGEMGHVRVSDEERPCICGRKGCLDLYFSHRVISEKVAALGRKGGRGYYSLEEIANLYRGGDPAVGRIIDAGLPYFTRALMDMVNLVEPDLVILTGELIGMFVDPVLKVRESIALHFRDSGFVKNLQKAEIMFRDLGTEIAAIGICCHLIGQEWSYQEGGDMI